MTAFAEGITIVCSLSVGPAERAAVHPFCTSPEVAPASVESHSGRS
jgi:hypothetical protein